jgi:AcrR family transcriptional regulator
MGRPREHDERTAAALLEAAERTVQEHGVDSLSVRGVAEMVGTSTRAVYSLFGSKGGLIAAISVHGFEVLREGIQRQPQTTSPAQDLVEVGLVFRRFVRDHPSIYRMAFQSGQMTIDPAVRVASAAALLALKERIARLEESGGLNGFGVDEATRHFDAVCEGLAELELRGNFPNENAGERLWRRALGVVISGLRSPPGGFDGSVASTSKSV